MSKNSNTILLKIIFFIETLILALLSFAFFTQLVNTINTKPTFTRYVSQNNTINKDEANKQLLEAAQHGNL